MRTTAKHSWTKQGLGKILAAVAFLAAVTPCSALDQAPARCGPNGDYGGGIKVSGCAIDECVRKGGIIGTSGGRAYCCVSSGYGADRVTVCDEVDQLIDMIQASPQTSPQTSPTYVWSPRPFGAVSRFAR